MLFDESLVVGRVHTGSVRGVAILSNHASPLAASGSIDCGGQNVYVANLARELALSGYMVDVFTRRDAPSQPPLVQWRANVRVVPVPPGRPFVLARCAAAHMRVNGGGHIINVASTAAKRGRPNASASHASKWGLLGLSHALHAELRPYSIKVMTVIAGGMRTPFLLDRFPDLDAATLQDPVNVAQAIGSVLLMPEGSVVAEITVLPLQESSWP